MEKAKQEVKDNLENSPKQDELILDNDVADVADAADAENLKAEINNICWNTLPSDLTMHEAEAISMTIYTMLISPRSFLDKK